MRVVFLGTCGDQPNERRHTSCVMLPEGPVGLADAQAIFPATQVAQDHGELEF